LSEYRKATGAVVQQLSRQKAKAQQATKVKNGRKSNRTVMAELLVCGSRNKILHPVELISHIRQRPKRASTDLRAR